MFAVGCGLKFVQLLQHFEHLGAALSSALEIFVNTYGVTSIVGEIMRYFVSWLTDLRLV